MGGLHEAVRQMPSSSSSRGSLGTQVITSGVVGSFCVGVFNPLDTARIRWQFVPEEKHLLSFIRKIVAREGLVRGLWWPGLTANMMAISISTGFRLGCYPTIRDAIVKGTGAGEKNSVIMFTAGLIPGLIGYWFINPLYLVKTQLQASAAQVAAGQREAPLYRGTAAGLKETFETGGFRAMYRGSFPLMCRGGLISAGQMLGYDGSKTRLKSSGLLNEGPVLHGVSSVIAATSATLFGNPCDRLFTKFTTAKQAGESYRSLLHCAQDIWLNEGPLAFYRGSFVFFLRSAPIFTLYFPIY